MPLPHQSSDGLLTCGKLLQQVGRGIEAAWDKGLEFGDPCAIVVLKREFETVAIPKNDHSSGGFVQLCYVSTLSMPHEELYLLLTQRTR